MRKCGDLHPNTPPRHQAIRLGADGDRGATHAPFPSCTRVINKSRTNEHLQKHTNELLKQTRHKRTDTDHRQSMQQLAKNATGNVPKPSEWEHQKRNATGNVPKPSEWEHQKTSATDFNPQVLRNSAAADSGSRTQPACSRPLLAEV